MKSYPSYIDGHPIPCQNLPTMKYDTNAAFVSLINRPIQISARGAEQMPRTKEVTVNDNFTLTFTLGKQNEYWNGKKSLTEYLLSFKRNAKVTIR